MDATFSINPISLESIGIPDFTLDGKIRDVLAKPLPRDWKKTGLSREYYLDFIEIIVRNAAGWIDEKGAVIDPYYKKEWAQTTPRFASSASVLLYFGRIPELKDIVHRTMTYSCRQLASGKGGSPDFWMRELVTAYVCLSKSADKKLVDEWKNTLAKIAPEKINKVVSVDGSKLGELHNWAVYGSAGESMKESAGIRCEDKDVLWGKKFFDKYISPQFRHFNSFGMYRDPNDPITYDITTRLQLAAALWYGYDWKLKPLIDELLRRGGITTLIFTSPAGFAPFGGRSGQFNFQEAIIAAICEIEAGRYKQNDPRLAGAFKRQAHLSAKSVERWLKDMTPLRHIKNAFPPESLHGIDEYGQYSVYSLFNASVFGLAALFADDTIEEAACPAEIGGFVLEISPSFHKVFATCQSTHIELDTCADLHYDSTGLGRFQAKGIPAELGLSMPFTSTPKFRLDKKLVPDEMLSICPSWQVSGKWISLASLSEGLKHSLEIITESQEKIDLKVKYVHAGSKSEITEQYQLSQNKLVIKSSVSVNGAGTERIKFMVPLLVTDGMSKSEIISGKNSVQVKYLGKTYEISFDEKAKAEIIDHEFANRNGIYKLLALETGGNEIEVKLEFQ
ncbi:MAG TPA: hypothetical protein DCZ94_20320 [Lentisphaeria bacterium]|nr:MAG: hypothetical protein A2X48_05905 [Lentisphaerae bacterium GWF2_49_21]HBC89293.1 hypothetical protein [Lentisphaeria bacterium]